MFYGKSNNNGSGVNVNTSFYTSYSDTSLLTVGGWNRNISVKLSPATGKDANGVTQYDTTNNIITSIREENAIALVEGFEKEIEPAIKNGTNAKVTIAMGDGENKKAFSIIYDGNDAYLEIATGVKEDGTTEENNVLTHKFNKKSYMVNYNWADGTGEEVPTEADLYNFVEKMRACQDLVPTVAHSINYSNANKAAYKNNQNSSYNNANNNYSAPTNNFSGSDMGDFLPYS